jgi:hypothetical protein
MALRSWNASSQNDTVSTPSVPETNADNPLPELPKELIDEILARLPVRSLLQFKRVCKSWKNRSSIRKEPSSNLHCESTSNLHIAHLDFFSFLYCIWIFGLALFLDQAFEIWKHWNCPSQNHFSVEQSLILHYSNGCQEFVVN